MGVIETEEASLLLDEKLLRFMDQLELLEEKRGALNSLIEQGWFSMSKARYSMGNKQVSALQYANKMEPLVCVNVRTHENGETEFCTERIMKKSPDDSEDARSVEDIGPKEEGLRRRNKFKKELTEKEEGDEAKSETPSTETVRPEGPPVTRTQTRPEQNPQQDPLKWFGILVPQSLKQAQSSFTQVIELSAEIAALQSAVLDTREELKRGMKLKLGSLEKSSTTQSDQITG